MKPKLLSCAATLAAGALVLSAAPASANVRSFNDAKGDTKASIDILRVRVINGGTSGNTLAVRMRFAEVSYGGDLRIFVDTRSNNPGPEWRMSGFADSEWVLERVDTWDGDGTESSCPGRVHLTNGDDVGWWRTSRSCLGVGEKVRVAVRTQEASSPQHDWARAYRMFLGWVAI